uniref:Uncharacterized protein n=1 Tax=Oryza punctata TaxID=4537 RepID=A0A0E0KNR2_ORYPU
MCTKPRRSVAALSVQGHDGPKLSPARLTRLKSMPDYDLSEHDDSPKSSSRRLTCSRAKAIGQALKYWIVEESAGVSLNKKKRIKEEMVGESPATEILMKKKMTMTGLIHREGHGTLASRPLPAIHPLYSTTPHLRKSSCIARLEGFIFRSIDPFPTTKLNLRRDKEHEPSIGAALPTPSHKNMVLGMSHSIVRVSSPPSVLVPSLVLKMSNNTPLTIFFLHCLLSLSISYRFISQISLFCRDATDSLIFTTISPFWTYHCKSPLLGQPQVFARNSCLVLDKNMPLAARFGAIMSSDCSFDGGVGGPVVNTGGSTIGMVYIDGSGAVIISISIIRTFFQMWKQFRPMFEVDLKSMELASVSLREELSLKHNMNGGFIVKHKANDSALEHSRRGDVIFFEDKCGTICLSWKYTILKVHVRRQLPYPQSFLLIQER